MFSCIKRQLLLLEVENAISIIIIKKTECSKLRWEAIKKDTVKCYFAHNENAQMARGVSLSLLGCTVSLYLPIVLFSLATHTHTFTIVFTCIHTNACAHAHACVCAGVWVCGVYRAERERARESSSDIRKNDNQQQAGQFIIQISNKKNS